MAGETVVVVNPRSQNGALGKKWPELARDLRREIGGFEPRLTEGPGDATRLAREAIRAGAATVVAVGGDGTIHEVANGFFEEDGERPLRPAAGRPALAVLPFGTGGDFRKTIHVPRDVADAGRIIKRGRRREIDVGALHFRRGGAQGPSARCVFVNIASFGIGGLVDQIVNASSKRLGGRLSFLLGTARAAVRYRNQQVRLRFDGDDEQFFHGAINNVAVANGRYFGGGMHIAPEAELDDGLFDVVTIGDVTTLDYLRDGARIYTGKHLGRPKIGFRRARRIDALPVDAGEDVLLDVDGEAPGALPATFTVLPRAIDLVVP